MKLTFLGGADEVGASCTLVEIAGKKLLIDAGIRISPKTSRGIQNDQLPDLQPISEAGGPDYILVTHAHTDHTGALPLVMEQYPYTPVLMTRPTQALTQVLQKDAQRIMRSNFQAEGELPLFDEISVNRLMDAIQLVEFDQPVKLGENLQVTYHVSGHIAGAALLVLESSEGTLVMSGDVSMSPQRTVKSIEIPRKISADALVLESTYGGKLHANREAEEKRLIANLQRITERGGKVLIPAFALGRSQEIVQIIHAFGDKLDIPVYVDGMVRTVCDAYARFADLLPNSTVRMADDKHLFFRGNVKPIRSRTHREEIARSREPIIVVASSGMLTGGASVVYAKEFARDSRNAILLTGYQDEESPGRFLQRVMREKDKGETPTLTIDGKKVKVRCEIDTYSLSAHADESELISIAQALKAQEVMLVHGDEGARHSLATGLRQRQIITTTPRIGTTREFSFKQRPWAIGTSVKKGSHTGDVDLLKLWESLKNQAGDFFSTRELAQVWWGDGARADAMQERLNMPDNVYFSADWRNKTTFQVRTEHQVERAKKQRRIMLANPDIVGKMIVLRNSNDQVRLGMVRAADVDRFEAIVQNAKGINYPADALLWVVTDWENINDEEADKSIRSQLNDVLKTARAHKDALLSYQKRKAIVDAGKPVNPEELLPDKLPDEVDKPTAIVGVVLGLARDGAVLEDGGLLPNRAREHEPLEQNEARELALSLFPDESRLRKVGMDVHRGRLLLAFDFPQAAMRNYDDQIEELIDLSGWDVKVRPQVNQQALAVMLEELLPEGVSIRKGPSYYMDKREVGVTLAGMDDDAKKALQQNFLKQTDFRLSIDSATPAANLEDIAPVATGEKLEINQAYTVIRNELEPLGLNKCGLKHGKIHLTFISPQIAERHMDAINDLGEKIGYSFTIHEHPNQHKIMEIASRLANAVGWHVAKGPGVRVDKALVTMSLNDAPNEIIAEQVAQEFHEQTGFTLEVDTMTEGV